MTKPSPGRRWRGWAGVGLLGAGAVAVWVVAGASWWAPALLVTGGLAGRLVAAVLPARYRTVAVRAGVLAAAVWLAAGLHAAGWAFVTGLAAVASVISWPASRAPGSRGHWTASWGRLVVGVVGGALLVTGVTGTAVERVQAQRAQDEIDARAGDFSRAQMLPASPAAAVQALVRAIAEDEPRAVCSAFSPDAAAELAAAVGAVDCADAVHQLHAQVQDPARYARPDRGTVTETVTPDGQTGTGDGCSLTWTGLPRLLAPGPAAAAEPPPGPTPGVLDGQRQLGQGYLVTGYRPCPR